MTNDRKLADGIGERQSIRRYLPAPIERPLIERLLAAATRAPSAHDRQPWRFAVLDDAASKRRLAEAMGGRLRKDRTADGDDAKAIDADVARSHARITGAPVVVVICVDIGDMDRYPDDRRSEAEYLMAVQSTAMAAQNLLLAAQSEGLGACVMCAPLFCPDTVSDALKLPQQWTAQMLVTIGAAAGPGKERPRRPLDDIVLWPSRGRNGRGRTRA
jgi:coenzyme F420-0:L-glutamate ligase/coenzyme F420-1:gamma-L-glutamate ligase